MNDTDEKLIAAIKDEQHTAPAHAVARWHDTIEQASALERGRQSNDVKSPRKNPFFWGLAVTAAMAAGIAIGLNLANKDHGTTILPQLAETFEQPAALPAAFTRGLQEHLRVSQATISNLPENAEATLLVLKLIEQNRMFESVADDNDAPHLARVLRAFEPILLELATSDIAPADALALRAQLEFELTVMLTKVRKQSSEQLQTT